MKQIKFSSLFLFLLLLLNIAVFAQGDIAKSWEGSLNVSGSQLKIIFHISKSDGGKLTGTLDSPDQGAKGIPITGITFENNNIKMDVGSIGGVYEGKVNEDFKKIKGDWKQGGASFPLALTPIGDSVKVNELNYISLWKGKLKAGSTVLTIIARFFKDEDGSFGAFMDSPDQGVKDLAAGNVHYSDDSVYFEISMIKGYFSGKFTENKTKIDGTWFQSGVSFPLILEKTDKIEEVKRPQEPKEPFPYNSEEVTFENKEGLTLSGTLTYPKAGTVFPAVVLVTGSGPQNRNEELLGHKPFLVWSDYLTRNGIAVLRYDDRGIGKSTGNFYSAITPDFAKDAIAAVNYLKTRKEINPKKIGIIGHSEGGIVAPIAANLSDDVSYIVLAAGTAVTGKDVILLQTELISRKSGMPENDIKKTIDITTKAYNAVANSKDSSDAAVKIDSIWSDYFKSLPDSEKNNPENSKEYVESQKRSILTPWFMYFLKFDPRTELVKLKVPVLAMFGENDLQVPPSQNMNVMESTLKKSNSKNYKVVVLPGLNHLFQESETGSPNEYAKIEQTTSPKMLELMTGWIKEVTK